MSRRIKFYSTLTIALILSMKLHGQPDSPASLEGGRGFVQIQSADLYGTGYIGLNLSGIYNTTKLKEESGHEHLFVGLTSLTYDISDELQMATVLYAIGKGYLYSSDSQPDRFQDGLGSARIAAKYRFPFEIPNTSLAARIALHIPMGANFTIHPSYPYDTDVYGLELDALQTFHLMKWLRVHFNEGYRWQGLKESTSSKDDLLLTSFAFDYNFSKHWLGFTELSSVIERDDHILPIEDRFVLSQGIQYVTPWNVALNLATNIRLSEKRKDGTPNRAEDWRIMGGISFSKRTFEADDDEDGIPNSRDIQPSTPKGWPVGSDGKALDSDGDKIPDGIDKEPNTLFGAKVDLQGRALDSDKDGVPDGIDLEDQTPKGAKVDSKGRTLDSDNDGIPDGIDEEPNTQTGAVVNVKGVSIDSDKDGVPDGIDIEPATPAGSPVDSKGKALPPFEYELLKNGLLRVHKIYFDVNKATIKPESYPILDEISRILNKYPMLQIQINGHTDADGGDEFNMNLSIDRAYNVRTYILNKGSDLKPENITIKGFGRSMPISDNRTVEGKTMNRRVEFVVLNPDQLSQ